MMGTDSFPGIIPRFARDLFRRIASKRDIEFAIDVSYLEIYNDNSVLKIADLLLEKESGVCSSSAMKKDLNSGQLKLREHPTQGTYVEELTIRRMHSQGELMKWLQIGAKKRATGKTTTNEQSSKSHSILSITITQSEKEEQFPRSCISKVHLIDLAGTCGEHDRLKEGNLINKSLLTLRKVISQLADVHECPVVPGHAPVHVPYRDSLLTFLLKDCLGGNCQTSMIATINAGKAHLDETLITLHYAAMARKIINIARCNEDAKTKKLRKLMEEIIPIEKKQKKVLEENERLKQQQEQVVKEIEYLVEAQRLVKEENSRLEEKQAQLIVEVKKFELQHHQVNKDIKRLEEQQKLVMEENKRLMQQQQIMGLHLKIALNRIYIRN
jgi:hypothetical protein